MRETRRFERARPAACSTRPRPCPRLLRKSCVPKNMAWEWEGEPGSWYRFSDADSAVLSAAFIRNDPFEILHSSAAPSSVSFVPLAGLQTNLDTGTSVPVRRVGGVSSLWEARTGQAQWTPYERDACLRMEAAWARFHAAGTVGSPLAYVDLTLRFGNGFGGRYRISFRAADGVQEDGRSGGLMRCVRRVPGAADGGGGVVTRAASRAGRAMGAGRGSTATTDGGAGPVSSASGGAASHSLAGPVSSSATAPDNSVFAPSSALKEPCCICLCDEAREDGGFVVLSICGHGFHDFCIRTHMKNKPLCPLCFTSYAVRTGNQPKGEMTVKFHARGARALSGHEREGTIEISYYIPSGTQGAEHPHPGRAYHGCHRQAYLPDSARGREVLRLLRLSFERRLTFTVGRSMTTGRDDCVTWSSVHHKTSRSGGQGNYGWPDATYFDRVTQELAALGVN